MRAISFAAALGILAAASTAHAQGQSTTMTVSVEVVRACTIESPAAGANSPRITAQCIGGAAPRTQLSPPTRVSAPASSPAQASSTNDRAFRVLTVNF